MRGPHVFAGYHRDAEATAAAFGEAGCTPATSVSSTRTASYHHRPQEGPDHHLERQEHLARTIERAARDALDFAGGRRGDRRPYLVALLTLDADELPQLAEQLGVDADPVVVAGDQRARELIWMTSKRSTAVRADRADQALRDPAARLHAGGRRAHADAEDQARDRQRPVPTRSSSRSTPSADLPDASVKLVPEGGVLSWGFDSEGRRSARTPTPRCAWSNPN